MTTTSEQQTIGATTFTTPSDHELAMTRTFDAPLQLVFDAWTKPEHLRNWMLGRGDWTMTACDIDLRPGGAWRFAWQSSQGCGDMATSGTYRDVAPPTRLVSTESWGGDYPETINTLALDEVDGMTRVTKTIRYPSKAARDAVSKTGMRQGVAASLDRLATYLDGLF